MMKNTLLLGSLLVLAVACGGAAQDAREVQPSTTSGTSTTPAATAGTSDATKTATDTAGSSNGTGGNSTVEATAGTPKLPPKPLQPVPAPAPTHTGDPAPKAPK